MRTYHEMNAKIVEILRWAVDDNPVDSNPVCEYAAARIEELEGISAQLLRSCEKSLDGIYDQNPEYETMTDVELEHPDNDCYIVEVILDVRAAIAAAKGGV